MANQSLPIQTQAAIEVLTRDRWTTSDIARVLHVSERSVQRYRREVIDRAIRLVDQVERRRVADEIDRCQAMEV